MPNRYVSVNLLPEARDTLQAAARRLAVRADRRVTLSETLVALVAVADEDEAALLLSDGH